MMRKDKDCKDPPLDGVPLTSPNRFVVGVRQALRQRELILDTTSYNAPFSPLVILVTSNNLRLQTSEAR